MKFCHAGHDMSITRVQSGATTCCGVCLKVRSDKGNTPGHTQEWRGRNREKAKRYARNYHLMKKFGITIEDFEELLASQGGICAICKTDTPGKNGWATDHCHKRNWIRGITCGSCNSGMGLLKDSPELLFRAAKYLGLKLGEE